MNCKVIFGLLIAAFTCTNVCGTELLKNGNFKEVANDRPTNWSFYDWNGTSSLNIIKEDQSNIAVIYSQNVDGKGTFTQNQSGLELKQGTTYRLSGWYNTEDIGLGDKGRLRVECVYNQSAGAEEKTNLKTHQAVNLTLSPGKWERFESVRSVPSPVTEFNFFILGYNFTGKLYLRDISLEAIAQTAEIKPDRKYVWREAEQIFATGFTSTWGSEIKDYFSGTGGAYGGQASFKWRFQIAPETDPQFLLPVNRQYYVWLRMYGYLGSPQVDVLFQDRQIASFKTVSNEIADAQGKYSAPGKYYWQKAGTFQSEGGPASLTFSSTQRMLLDAVLITDDPAYEPVGFEAAKASDKNLFTDFNTPHIIKTIYNFNGVSDKIASPLDFMFYNDNNRQIKIGDKPAILRLVLPKAIQIAGATAHWGGVSWGYGPNWWGDKRLSWEKKGAQTINGVDCNVYEFYYYFLGLTTTLFIKADSQGFKHGEKYIGEYQLEFNGIKQPMEKLVLDAVELKPAAAFKDIWIGFMSQNTSQYFDYPQLVDALVFSGINLLGPTNIRYNYDLFEKFADECLENRIMIFEKASPLAAGPLSKAEQMVVTLEGAAMQGFPSLSLDENSPAVQATCRNMEDTSSSGFGISSNDEWTNQLKDSADYNPATKKLFEEYLKKKGLEYVDPVTVVKNKESYAQLYAAWIDFRCERTSNFHRLYQQAYLKGFAKSGGKYTFGKTMYIPQILKNSTALESKINSCWDYKELAQYCDYISPMIYTYSGIGDSAEVGDTLKMYNDYIGRKVTVPTLLSEHPGFGEVPLLQKAMLKYQIFESLMQQSRVIMLYIAPTPMNPLNLQFISDAIRQAGPYEDIILNGQQIKVNASPEWVRINALQLNKQILVYATNYRNEVSLKAKIHLTGKAVKVLDIENGKTVPIADNFFETDFRSSRGKLFLATME
ncbi:MAG: hypothetical protein ABII89_06585 [Candidatus Omnitrophota bacterium]